MASLLPQTSTPLQNPLPFILSPSSKPSTSTHLNPSRKNPSRCSAIFGQIQEDFLTGNLHLDQSSPLSPSLQSGFLQFKKLSSELPEIERWEILVVIGLGWVYLTARPRVLMGAIDAYVLAPLQLGLDGILGRRNLKMSDFVVGERLGEGSFGVVYSGAIVPKSLSAEERVGRRGKRLGMMDERFKEKVILKKVKVGTLGAEECGDFEEWFNYRVSRAAPESCAEFLGSFVAEKTLSEFTKGGKWLVWKFEACQKHF